MITLQPDPKEIIIFCDHLAVMCSKYESSRKTPKELVTDFFQDIAPEDCSFDIDYVIEDNNVSNYGDAMRLILKLYFHGIPEIERFH